MILQNENKGWLWERNKIGDHIKSYFKKIYNEGLEPDEMDLLFTNCITEDENFLLYKSPDKMEIKTTLWDMHNLKAPGIDGFPALFYKRYWNILGGDPVKVVQYFFINKYLHPELSKTMITLLPKRYYHTLITHFRPVSLCNVRYYKIIEKIIYNKLKPLFNISGSLCP